MHKIIFLEKKNFFLYESVHEYVVKDTLYQIIHPSTRSFSSPLYQIIQFTPLPDHSVHPSTRSFRLVMWHSPCYQIIQFTPLPDHSDWSCSNIHLNDKRLDYFQTSKQTMCQQLNTSLLKVNQWSGFKWSSFVDCPLTWLK